MGLLSIHTFDGWGKQYWAKVIDLFTDLCLFVIFRNRLPWREHLCCHLSFWLCLKDTREESSLWKRWSLKGKETMSGWWKSYQSSSPLYATLKVCFYYNLNMLHLNHPSIHPSGIPGESPTWILKEHVKSTSTLESNSESSICNPTCCAAHFKTFFTVTAGFLQEMNIKYFILVRRRKMWHWKGCQM